PVGCRALKCQPTSSNNVESSDLARSAEGGRRAGAYRPRRATAVAIWVTTLQDWSFHLRLVPSSVLVALTPPNAISAHRYHSQGSGRQHEGVRTSRGPGCAHSRRRGGPLAQPSVLRDRR